MSVPFAVLVAVALYYLAFDGKDFKWAVIAGGVLLCFFVIMGILQLLYINVYIAPDKIRIRYKSLSPFPSPKNSVLIKPNDFHNYKITKSLFGTKQSLTLSVKTPGGVAEFSKISLLCMPQAQIDKTTKALDLLIAMNKKKD